MPLHRCTFRDLRLRKWDDFHHGLLDPFNRKLSFGLVQQMGAPTSKGRLLDSESRVCG